ncbi:MAG TPA: hypothetical protein VE685_10635 [Thermoanaerobaculia bacterium]|nr:hypothetical protein [Thermoanaerobaculia bacterium]
MSKKIFTTLALALFVFAGVASAQEAASSRDALAKALEGYAAKIKAELRSGEGAVPKAVPRTDKAEATFIGTLALIDDTDFLDDGTPFRLVAIDASRPVDQFHFIFCLGSSSVNSCGRLREGRRVQFTADVLTVEDGDNAGLALFVAKRIKT